MGDLIRMPHSELHATIEVLDRLGVTPRDFEILRKASSWSQATIARVHKMDPSVWAVLELGDAAVREGFTTDEFLILAGRKDLLGLVRQAIHGQCQGTQVVQHTTTIDCDAKPFEPNGLTVAPESDQLPNRVRGQFAFDPAKVKLYLSPNQRGGRYINGEKLKNELADEPVLPANVLDFYLANTCLIPEEWKGKAVFFWGTIYRGSDGGLYVRYLSFDGSGWYSGSDWLGHDWDGDGPAAVRAS